MQWGTRLLKDFNDLDAYRVNAKDSLENLGEFYHLDGFNLPENKQSFPAIFWEQLYPIYQDFQSLLLNHQGATLEMLYQDALDALEIYLSHTTKAHYFIGFNALNQAEQDLIQEFLAKNKGEVLWDLDQVFLKIKSMLLAVLSVLISKTGSTIVNIHKALPRAHFLKEKNIQADWICRKY